MDSQKAEKVGIYSFFEQITDMLTSKFKIAVDEIGNHLIGILVESIFDFDRVESAQEGSQNEEVAEAVNAVVQIIQIITCYVTRTKGAENSLIIKYLQCLIDDQIWQPDTTLLNHGHIQIRRAFTLSVVDLKYAAEETVENLISQSLTEGQLQIVNIYLEKKRALLNNQTLTLHKQSKSAGKKPRPSKSPLSRQIKNKQNTKQIT